MRAIKHTALSKVHENPPPQERLEQNITDLEIDSIEKDVSITDLEIAVMELQEQSTTN